MTSAEHWEAVFNWWFLALCAWLAWGTIGGLIGRSKDRTAEGVFLGFLLGPIGWVWTLCLADYRSQCPSCLGRLNTGATRCCHCGQNIKYETLEGESSRRPTLRPHRSGWLAVWLFVFFILAFVIFAFAIATRPEVRIYLGL